MKPYGTSSTLEVKNIEITLAARSLGLHKVKIE